MVKDRRYETIKKLVRGGFLKTISEVRDVIPKSKISLDLSMHHRTFSKLIKNPRSFTFDLAYRLAVLFEIDREEVIKMIHLENLKREDKKNRTVGVSRKKAVKKKK